MYHKTIGNVYFALKGMCHICILHMGPELLKSLDLTSVFILQNGSATWRLCLRSSE
jgi:hypothetical protein